MHAQASRKLTRPFGRTCFATLVITCVFAARIFAEDATALFAQGRDLMRRDQFAAAVPLFEKCVAAEPANSKFHQWLARALGLQAARDGIMSSVLALRKVKAELEKAISLDPRNLEARQDLAIMYRALPGIIGGSKAKAAEQVAIIRKDDPALAAQLEGDFLAADNKYNEALAAYGESARLNARPIIYVRMALIHHQKKEWDKAFAALERSLALDANYPLALYQIGRTAAFSGQQLDRGEKCLRTYIAMPVRQNLEDPAIPSAHVRLGNILEKKGNPGEARAEYEAALKIDPTHKQAREALSKLKR